MDEAGHRVFILRLDRHDVAVGARGDYRVLERLGVARRGDYLLQRLAHPRACGADEAADIGELGARGIGYLLLAGYRARNLVLEEAVGLYGLEEIVDAGLLPSPPVAGGVGLRGAGRGEDAGDVHELARVQNAAHVRALQACADVLEAGEARAPARDHHAARGARLGEAAAHLGLVRAGREGPRPRLGRLAHRFPLEHGEHGGQLQRDGASVVLGHFSCSLNFL